MVCVIGGGPVGSYSSYLLAKAGFDVDLYEEHKEIGKPVQCTGLVTSALDKVIKIKEDFVINRIRKSRVVSPDGNFAEFTLKKSEVLVDRGKFDRFLFDLAKEEGVKTFLQHKFISSEGNKIKFKKKIVKSDILVGADGPLSQVAKSNDMFQGRKFLLGLQARVKGSFEKDTIISSFGDIAPGFFSWIVPENEEIARVGVASNENVTQYFDKFMKWKIIDKQVGLMPIYNPDVVAHKDNVYLVGDAATQVKPTTGGGIVPGMMAAKDLVKAIKYKKNYDELWKSSVGKELDTGLKVRKILNKFNNSDYNYLVKLTSQNRVRSIVEEGNRDFPFAMLLKLAITEPRFIKFGSKVF
jgi:geranylgeranyl reductase family protein